MAEPAYRKVYVDGTPSKQRDSKDVERVEIALQLQEEGIVGRLAPANPLRFIPSPFCGTITSGRLDARHARR